MPVSFQLCSVGRRGSAKRAKWLVPVHPAKGRARAPPGSLVPPNRCQQRASEPAAGPEPVQAAGHGLSAMPRLPNRFVGVRMTCLAGIYALMILSSEVRRMVKAQETQFLGSSSAVGAEAEIVHHRH